MVAPYSKPLSLFFESEFLPEVLGNAEKNTQDAYKKAVRRFVQWSACDIQMHCVTEGILDRFQRAVIIEGMTPKNARAICVYVRRIVRYKYKDRCLKQNGRRPHETHPLCWLDWQRRKWTLKDHSIDSGTNSTSPNA